MSPLPVLPIVLALARYAPSVVGLLTKDKTASQAAELVSKTAQAVTGTDNDDAALEALKNDPKLVLEYQQSMNAHVASMYEEETKRINMVTETMQLEAANKHAFVRNMRPLFGYTVIYCLFMTFNTVLYTLLRYGPEDAIKVIGSFSKMEWVYVAMFTAIGVYIKKRSDDKNTNRLGLIGAIAKKMSR